MTEDVDGLEHDLRCIARTVNASVETCQRIEDAADYILALTEAMGKMRDHIAEQITHAETRIQDGVEMGATVWRIALEDVARENRAALTLSNEVLP
jgi:uncharacterized protein (UPF0248 family)